MARQQQLDKAPTPVQSQTGDPRTGDRRAESRTSRKISKNPATMHAKNSASPTPATFNEKPSGKDRVASHASHREGPRRLYKQNPASVSSIGQENFSVGSRPPTLRAQRSRNESNIVRRRSSKRKAEDIAREEKVRSMSSPVQIPKRPASHIGSLPSDTRTTPKGSDQHRHRPGSEVSLSLPHSLTESMAASHSFKVSNFNALTPRPTIKYAGNARSAGPNDSRASARFEKRPAIPEEETKGKKRIEELADDLDAGDIRQLLERDARRREKKSKVDPESLDKKLRRAERHRDEGSNRGRKATKAQNEERKGTDEMQGVEKTQTSESKPPVPEKDDTLPEKAAPQPTMDEPLEPPPNLKVLTESSRLRATSPLDTRMSQKSASPSASPNPQARNRTSLTQMSGLARQSTPDIPEYPDTGRRASNQSATQGNSWTTFFKRGSTRAKRSSVDRGRKPPSEFSNTSRESFARQPPTQAPPPANRTFRRSSGTPQRTRSKFREDLPEFPLSPPDSRVQSPEVVEADVKRMSRGSEHASRHLSMQSQHSENPPVSQSLASVDSEASWLSGRPVKRSSLPISQTMKRSDASLGREIREHSQNRDPREETDVADDEYFKRLTPEQNRRRSRSANRKASSAAINFGGDSDNENIDPEILQGNDDGPALTQHEVPRRQPTLVKQQGTRPKSKQGLLNEYHSQEDEATSPEEEEEEEEEEGEEGPSDSPTKSAAIMRATSVDYGKKHARHFSTGSAKLLELRRSSTDSKRRSITEYSSRQPSPGLVMRDPNQPTD
ncbi:MAG: hypothetical protein Q9227_004482 [Pyrenula ochraceoflavens]